MRSLCSPALCRPPPPAPSPFAPMLPGELNIHWHLISMSGRRLPHKCTFLIEYTANAAATAPGHTENLKVIRDSIVCQLASPKKKVSDIMSRRPVPPKSFSRHHRHHRRRRHSHPFTAPSNSEGHSIIRF